MKQFKCSKCKKGGFMSIYPTEDGKVQCTNCANGMRIKNKEIRV